jgi:hypothetical protein
MAFLRWNAINLTAGVYDDKRKYAIYGRSLL